jgi:hypothetical protein
LIADFFFFFFFGVSEHGQLNICQAERYSEQTDNKTLRLRPRQLNENSGTWEVGIGKQAADEDVWADRTGSNQRTDKTA